MPLTYGDNPVLNGYWPYGSHLDIKTEVIAIINANVPEAYVVYDHAEPAPAGYPAVDVTDVSQNGAFLNIFQTQRHFRFSIMCRQERTIVGPQSAEQIIESLVDSLFSAFDSASSLTLNGAAVFYNPVEVQFGYLQSPDIDVRTAEVFIEAIDIR